MKNIVIIGGGVIGLCSAYYLAKEGHQVTIVDKGNMDEGCSFGNAGMIVPSHVVPLAAPGMISQGIKWMFDSKSPFYVKPRLSSELMGWGMKFYKSANKSHVERAMPALRDLSLMSKELYQQINQIPNDFNYEEKGLLMLYKTDHMAEEEIHVGKEAQRLGLEVDFLNKEEVTALETGLPIDVIGGVHYRSDAHLYPKKLISFFRSQLDTLGVVVKTQTEVTGFTTGSNGIESIETNVGEIKADEFILATGAWSPKVMKGLGINLSVLPGKGYSFTLKDQQIKPTIPTILCESKVAVTPMGNDLRFGGTMEITHTNDTAINKNRLQGIYDAIGNFYPGLEVEFPKDKDIWYGYRPCSPDGLPYIGRSSKYQNMVVATGHAMMGLSLAPATGKLIQEIIENKKTSININMFDPNRVF